MRPSYKNALCFSSPSNIHRAGPPCKYPNPSSHGVSIRWPLPEFIPFILLSDLEYARNSGCDSKAAISYGLKLRWGAEALCKRIAGYAARSEHRAQ